MPNPTGAAVKMLRSGRAAPPVYKPSPPVYKPVPAATVQRQQATRVAAPPVYKIPVPATAARTVQPKPQAGRTNVAPPVYKPVPVTTVQRQPAIPPAATVQMSPWKTFLNIASLGIRKAYVNNKRAKRRRQANAMLVPVIEQNQQVKFRHRDAYDQSIKYHSTHSDNVPSITKTGLLNQTDRVKKLQTDVGGMSQLGGEYKGDEKKGVFFGGRKFALEYKPYFPKGRIRVALPPERSNKPLHWDEDPTGSDDIRIFKDEKFRGGGLYTPASIGPEFIWSGKFTALAESEDPVDQQKVEMICRTLASHYPNPQPSWQEVLQIHLRAIDDGEVSDEELTGRYDD